MPIGDTLITCDDVQYLFDRRNHMDQVFFLSFALLCGIIICIVAWHKRKNDGESRARIILPLQGAIALSLVLLFVVTSNLYGQRMFRAIKAHCAITQGQIFEKNHYIRPSRWGYKYSYWVAGKKLEGDQPASEKIPDSLLDSRLYLVVYDSLDPSNSILDFSKLIR